MTWDKASADGAVYAAWGGLILAVCAWLITCSMQSGEITVANLGTNEAMLIGNLVAILSSGAIHYWHSTNNPQNFDFTTLDEKIKLVENDTSGLTGVDKDPKMLAEAYKWITRRGYALTIILVIIWPILSYPAGKFTRSYFAFWVLLSVLWGFGAAIIITVLPLLESSDSIMQTVRGIMGIPEPEPEPDSAGNKETEGKNEVEMTE